MQLMIEKETDTISDLKDESDNMSIRYTKKWGITRKDEKKFMNSYKTLFYNTCERIEDFKNVFVEMTSV